MNLVVVHIDKGSMSERLPDLVVGAALHVLASFANANRPLIYFAPVGASQALNYLSWIIPAVVLRIEW